jgi:triosephosphate isomerase
MSKVKKLIVGNWKMNGSIHSNSQLVQALLETDLRSEVCDTAVCVPSIYIPQVQALLHNSAGSSQHFAIGLGAQDVSAHEVGAYTGEISAAMLKEHAVSFAIVGHSERRQFHHESDQLVAIKAQRLLSAGITPIVCVGETKEERESGLTPAVVRRQLAAVIHLVGHCIGEIVLAYEPVWAIGTGLTATPEQAQEVHAVLRAQLRAASAERADHIRILYGGSMNPKNAKELLAQADIDGGLIGGAALKAADFSAIIHSV